MQLFRLACCLTLAAVINLFGRDSTLAQGFCEPRSWDEQVQEAVAIVDVSVVSIVPVENRADVNLWIDQIVKDNTATLEINSMLTLPTSALGTRIVGEVPFDEWRSWRLFLKPLEPNSSQFTTRLCDGSTMIPREHH